MVFICPWVDTHLVESGAASHSCCNPTVIISIKSCNPRFESPHGSSPLAGGWVAEIPSWALTRGPPRRSLVQSLLSVGPYTQRLHPHYCPWTQLRKWALLFPPAPASLPDYRWPFNVLAFPGGSVIENLHAMEEAQQEPGSIPESGSSPGEANGSSLLYFAWEVPWTGEPGGL